MELCIVFPCCFIGAFPEVLQFLTFSDKMIFIIDFHYCRMYRGVVPEELMVCGISLSLWPDCGSLFEILPVPPNDSF